MTRIHVVGAAIIESARCLIAQRGEGRAFAGAWEFPGGKVEADEAPEAALRREIHEELGVAIVVGPKLGRGEARDGELTIVLDVYAARITQGEPRAHEHQALRWVAADELDALSFAPADVPVLESVRRALACTDAS